MTVRSATAALQARASFSWRVLNESGPTIGRRQCRAFLDCKADAYKPGRQIGAP
jgi:hypothetical protein